MNPLSNPCPNCKATAGNFCEFPDERSGGGFVKQANRFHAERATDVITNLPDHRGRVSEEAVAAHAPDPINPSHYKGDLVMRIIEHFELDKDFPLGNVIKYILRHKSKAGLEDLKKARWYLDRRIAQLEGTVKGDLS